MVFKECALPKNTSASAVLGINSQGRLDSFVLRGSSIPQALSECLQSELASWEFVPATVDGLAVPSELKLIVLFEPQEDLSTRWRQEYARAITNGVSLLELQPLIAAGGGSQWIASYGGGCCVTLTKSHP